MTGDRAWQPIDTAPYGREIEVKIGRLKIRAQLARNASMTEDEVPCDQWQATTDRYTKCWSAGCCWESNAEGFMSEQPEAWREVQS